MFEVENMQSRRRRDKPTYMSVYPGLNCSWASVTLLSCRGESLWQDSKGMRMTFPLTVSVMEDECGTGAAQADLRSWLDLALCMGMRAITGFFVNMAPLMRAELVCRCLVPAWV